ncbi:MAG: hypothetical protein WA814_13370 [Candidatus Baltobacteraceae bacterium]
MFRRLNFGFIVVFVTAFIVVACGRQVTPNPPGLGAGGAPPGYMAIHFDTQSLFNFQSYKYLIVFNTTGSGITPSTDTLQTNWAGYSFALAALGTGGTSYAEPVQFVRNGNPHIPPAWLTLGTTPTQFTYNPNSNGSGTEFSMIFQRSIFKGIASPSPGPTATPSDLWTFNAFVTQGSGVGGQWYFLDSMGAGGPIDPQFVLRPQLCVTEPFDNTYFALYTGGQDPAAEILSIEISNNPVSPTPCP